MVHLADSALNEACPTCGSVVGAPCRSKGGKELTPSLTHKKRMDIVRRREMTPAIPAQKAINATSTNVKVVTAMKDYAEQDLRATKIEAAMFGMRIARKLGMSQDALDRKLAEMIVDSGLDEEGMPAVLRDAGI